MSKQTIRAKQLAIQSELKAPKSQYNKFGDYRYRSCEDILEAVKPLCIKYGAVLDITDELVYYGDRHYIKATARLTCVETGDTIQASAYAREPENKKGMDPSQITGAASSYARKYALNGLLCIDDTKDADTNEAQNAANNAPEEPLSKNSKSKKSDPAVVDKLVKRIETYQTVEDLSKFSEQFEKELASLSEEDKARIRKMYYDKQRELRK